MLVMVGISAWLRRDVERSADQTTRRFGIPGLAHVLVGEPEATSPRHVL
jgi:hypothetical protein